MRITAYLIFVCSCLLLLLSCKNISNNNKDFDPVSISQAMTPYPVIEGTELELGLAGFAKVFCSALFVSGREPAEAFKNSGYFLVPEEEQEFVTHRIDYDNKSVELVWKDSLVRKAKYYGDQGCIICKDNEEKIFFDPVTVETTLPNADTQGWPMGDAVMGFNVPKTLNQDLIDNAVDAAFDPPETLTAAFIVLHKGKIIAERYGAGADKDMQLESWSMGKSLTATLIGRMIQQGYFLLDDPAPVEAWCKEEDYEISNSYRDLLQMSAGLKFTAHRDPEADQRQEYLDHFYIYTGDVDAFEFSINRPLEFPVGSTGRYRNCDPLSLGYIMRTSLESKGINYHQYAQQELFDLIGIRKQVLETDPYGNFLLSGYDYGTARNWARLGQLYLQDGRWTNKRILPEGWSEFVSTPAPGWDEPVYGGLFWINGTGDLPLPQNSYMMAGAGGQRTIIVPDHDLVIVRMGHFRGSGLGMEALERVCELLIEAVRGDHE